MRKNKYRAVVYILSWTVAAFALNWFWEMLQMPAYTEMAGKSWSETALRCTIATVGDVLIIWFFYLSGALAARSWTWSLAGTWSVYAAGALLGLVFSILLEQAALGQNRWSYNEYMPVLPGVRAGLWPVLQLTILTPLAWWLGKLPLHSLLRSDEVESRGAHC